MDLETQYLLTALPETVTLLHQRLRPYSLGHEMLLRRIGSPFVVAPADGEAEAGGLIPPLLIAVRVCVEDYDGAVAALDAPGLPREIFRWRKRLGRFDETATLQTFIRYLLASRAWPESREAHRPRERVRRLAAPLLAAVFRTLTAALHFTRTEALNCPYAWARWLHAFELERAGFLKITSDEERATSAAVRAAFAAAGLEPARAEDCAPEVRAQLDRN